MRLSWGIGRKASAREQFRVMSLDMKGNSVDVVGYRNRCKEATAKRPVAAQRSPSASDSHALNLDHTLYQSLRTARSTDHSLRIRFFAFSFLSLIRHAMFRGEDAELHSVFPVESTARMHFACSSDIRRQQTASHERVP